MLDKWKQTVLIIVSALFAIAAVWGWNIPIDENTIQTLVSVIFAILSAFGFGSAVAAKILGKK